MNSNIASRILSCNSDLKAGASSTGWPTKPCFVRAQHLKALDLLYCNAVFKLENGLKHEQNNKKRSIVSTSSVWNGTYV